MLMVEFFRHCPGCGRRFHIKLVEKDDLGRYDTESAGRIIPIAGRGGVVALEEGPTMYFDVKEFAYHYKCKHCGHEWNETRLEDKPVETELDQIND